MTAVSMPAIVDHNETSMPLDEYRRKRDFSRTPEPEGGRPGRSRRGTRGEETGGYFCVQKHLASHLHYDLRLEHEGVLLSRCFWTQK